MLRETSFVVPLVVLMVFATVAGGPCLAAAQDSSASVQSAASIVKNSSLLTQAGVQPAPLQSTPSPSLAINRHALSMAPPTDIATALADGNLPSPSGKEHPLISLSKTSLLAPTKIQPVSFRDFSAPGLNASKLRSAKQPDLSSIQ
jgi:hypothetical protein